jgi:putative toxin-antitoxin system antitoxin component (TIGR02293 family)
VFSCAAAAQLNAARRRLRRTAVFMCSVLNAFTYQFFFLQVDENLILFKPLALTFIFDMRHFVPIFGKNVAMAKYSKTKQTNKQVKNMSNDLLFWLSGSVKMNTIIRSPFDDIDLAIEGVSKASIDNLATRLGISRKKMAENILSLSVKSMERKGDSEKLDKKTSSHAIEIARVMQHAYQVFENEDKVKDWMNRENRSVKNRKPIELLETLSGINLVNDILGRIEEGVYS